MIRWWSGALLVAGMGVLGCPDEPDLQCDPGRVAGCPCANGAHGTQTCYSDGSGWSSCDCRLREDGGEPADASAGTDASARDRASVDNAAGGDASGASDASAPVDAAAGADASHPVDAAVADTGRTDAAAADGALAPDTGSPLDASAASDAGVASDAPAHLDSGPTPDASTTADAGAVELTVYDLQDPTRPAHPALDTLVQLTLVQVTAVDRRGTTQGFWVQEPTGGAHSGIYVHKQSSHPFDLSTLLVGDLVDVRGTYTEFDGQLSEIILESARLIGSTTPAVPVAAADIATQPERWEGVLVRLQPACAVEALLYYGEVQTSCGVLDDEIAAYSVDLGQVFTHLDGIWHYSYGAFKLLPRDGLDFGALTTPDAGIVDAAAALDASLGQDANIPCSSLADARAALPGPTNLRLCDVLVTYTRTLGFFVQDAVSGPALFVFANPTLLDVAVGDRVTLQVTALEDFEGMREASQVAVLGNDHGGHDVLGLRQDLSTGSGVSPSEGLEAELVRLQGATVVSGFNRDWVIRYGNAPVTANFYAYEGATAGLCPGATFDLVTGYVGEDLSGHSIRAYNLADFGTVDTGGCGTADMANWDFEDFSSSPIPGFEYLTGLFTVTQNSGNPHAGLSAAALTWTSPNNQDLRAGFRSAVTLYQTYRCHLWVYDNDVAGDVRLFIHWFDAAGQLLSSSFPGQGVGYSVNQPAWQELGFQADAPPNAATMSCGVRMYDTTAFWDGDATVLVDDLSISLP